MEPLHTLPNRLNFLFDHLFERVPANKKIRRSKTGVYNLTDFGVYSIGKVLSINKLLLQNEFNLLPSLLGRLAHVFVLVFKMFFHYLKKGF